MWDPRGRIQLEHQRPLVAVNHQAGQAIVFAVHQPVAGDGLRAPALRQRQASLCRQRQSGTPPFRVNGGRLAVLQDAHPDGRMGVVQAHGQKVALAVKDHGQITGSTRVALLADRPLEQPRMPPPQCSLRLWCHA